MKEQDIRKINVLCRDGVELSATLYYPKEEIKGAVMFAPATGIKQGFYTNLATYLAENGYACISFDNRGIGESLTGSLKGSQADLVQWGALDMSAVYAKLKSLFPESSYHLVGHSAGGQLVGLMEDAQSLMSQFNFACSSGQMKLMSNPYKLKARFFMHVFMPLSNLLFGYAKNDVLGMGEPLPKNVAKQWTKWCAGQGYVKTDFGNAVKEHLYDEISFPSKWVIALDDDIATPATMDDMISVMPNLQVEKLFLDPEKLNKSEIGHMGFFSRKHKDLWPILLDWLEKHSV